MYSFSKTDRFKFLYKSRYDYKLSHQLYSDNPNISYEIPSSFNRSSPQRNVIKDKMFGTSSRFAFQGDSKASN